MEKDRPASPTTAAPEGAAKAATETQTQEENGEAKPQTAQQQDEGGVGTGQGAPAATGARRKWLPFGRNSNAKNKLG